MKKIILLLCVISVLLPNFCLVSYAEKSANDKTDLSAELYTLEKQQAAEDSYLYWLINGAFEDKAGNDTVLTGDSASSGEDSDGSAYYEWQITPELTGRHYIRLTYAVADQTRDDLEGMLTVNGKAPYAEIENFKLEREYYDVSEPTKDYSGNEVRPEDEEQRGEITNFVYDYSYEYSEPLSVNLEAGKKTAVRLTLTSSRVEIKNITLIPAGNITEYSDWIKAAKERGYTDANQTVAIEAEDYDGKSSTTIYPISDRSSAATSPQDSGKILLNTVGGYHWNQTGQYLKWNVNVKEAGLYKISLRVRQNTAPGQTSSRTVTVNGEIPFVEAMSVAFTYDSSWQIVTLGGETDYYFYLNAGDNEIKLQNTLGEMDSVLRVLNNSIDAFNAIYRKFLPVLSASPDLLRDYRLGTLYPNQVKELGRQAEILTVCADWIESYCGSGNSGAAQIRNFVRQLEGMAKDADTIPKEYSYFKSNIGSLSTWIAEATEQPLEIDCITVGNDKEKLPKASAGFFKQLAFFLADYLSSYITDYETVGAAQKTDSDSTLTVWVSAGREQAQLIRNMTTKSFTQQTGIPVSVKNVSASLMTATVAGIGPDVVVRSSPDVFNFAMRNASYPMSDFEDFEEIAERFDSSSLITLKYLDKYYGLPETFDYNMLFYRTDILAEMGLSVPQTWDDLIAMSSVLSNNNMEIGLPDDSSIYLMLLKQNGQEVYADGGKYSLLDTVDAINVFDTFTNFYVSYGFPLSYNFVNRFRSGEMPVAVAAFSTYNNLQISAPEINGLWEMTLIPGTRREDGNIDRTGINNVSAAMILADTDRPEEAWEFVKWWTSAEIQIDYADEIESVLGRSSRYNSANTEAFQNSNWTRQQKAMIQQQGETLTAIEPVPGGYYLARNINNAFRSVVYNGASATDAMYEYTYKINAEIDKKRIEFGLETR